MTRSIVTPQPWHGQFEEQLFLAVARRHVPGFPEKLTVTPREPSTGDEHAAIADYYTRMAAHDLFIVQVVARAIDTLFNDAAHIQLILSRQLGDDGAHAAAGRERVAALTGRDPLPDIEHLVQAHWARIGDLAVRDLAGFLAFEWHYELHILAKLWIQRKTARIGDGAMRDYGETRIRPDEEWHRVQIVEWWRQTIGALPALQRTELIDRVLDADDATQRRLDGYIHDEYEHTAQVFGADITGYRAIYDDWRREMLARLTGCDALRPLTGLTQTSTTLEILT